MNILVAEDDPINRDMLVRRLTRRGYCITEAENGQEAIDKTTLERPNIILMDIAMPICNGWEALGHIHQHFPEIPIIILSAHSMADDRDRALQGGAHAYLSKPIDFERLIETIERYGR